jgi:hypothetical protein
MHHVRPDQPLGAVDHIAPAIPLASIPAAFAAIAPNTIMASPYPLMADLRRTPAHRTKQAPAYPVFSSLPPGSLPCKITLSRALNRGKLHRERII